MVKETKPRRLAEAVRYGMVGAVSTSADFCTYTVCGLALGHAKSLLWIAVAAGYGVGTIVGYLLNSRWTFHYDTKGKEAQKLAQFALVACFGMLLTQLIVNTLVHAYNTHWLVAKLIAVATVFFPVFGVNKLWTFKKA